MIVGGLKTVSMPSNPVFGGDATAVRFLSTQASGVASFAFTGSGAANTTGMGYSSGSGDLTFRLNGTTWGFFSGGTGAFTLPQTASGANAIIISNNGARLKFSSGGTTDYLDSDGSGTTRAGGHFSTSGDCTVGTGSSGDLITKRHTYLKLGGSSQAASNEAIGTIDADFSAVGSGAGASDLITYTLPASSFTATAGQPGRAIKIKAWGTTANNANAKTVALIFGGTTLITKALTVSVAGIWEIEAIVARTGTSTQKYYAKAFNFGAATPTLAATDGATIYSQHTATTASETETGTITIKGRATVATASNDIVQQGMLIEFTN